MLYANPFESFIVCMVDRLFFIVVFNYSVPACGGRYAYNVIILKGVSNADNLLLVCVWVKHE